MVHIELLSKQLLENKQRFWDKHVEYYPPSSELPEDSRRETRQDIVNYEKPNIENYNMTDEYSTNVFSFDIHAPITQSIPPNWCNTYHFKSQIAPGLYSLIARDNGNFFKTLTKLYGDSDGVEYIYAFPPEGYNKLVHKVNLQCLRQTVNRVCRNFREPYGWVGMTYDTHLVNCTTIFKTTTHATLHQRDELMITIKTRKGHVGRPDRILEQLCGWIDSLSIEYDSLCSQLYNDTKERQRTHSFLSYVPVYKCEDTRVDLFKTTPQKFEDNVKVWNAIYDLMGVDNCVMFKTGHFVHGDALDLILGTNLLVFNMDMKKREELVILINDICNNQQNNQHDLYQFLF